jgi:hypothetical protein
MGGAAVLGGMASMVSESSEAIDNMADLSDRLGVATERLTGLGHAAALNGSSAEALNDALDTISKTIGTLNEKGGRNAKVLGQMGVDIAHLATLSPDEMFLELADAMSKLGTAQERAALAGFLKLGPEMVTVLMQGRDALESNVREAEELGIAYSRFDADKVKRMADAWDRTGAAMKGAANEAAIGFAPIFEGLALATQDALNIGKLIRGGESATQQGLPRIVGLRSKEERDKLFEQRNAGAAAVKAVEAEEEQGKLNDKMLDFIERLQLQADTYGMASDAAQLYEMRMKGATQADLEAAQSLIDQKAKMEESKKLRDESAKAEKKNTDDLMRLADSIKTPAQEFMDDFSQILDIAGTKAGFENPDVIRGGLEDLASRIKDKLGAEGPVGNQSTAAIRAGSIEALRAQFSGGGIAQKQLKEAEKQTKEQESMRGLLETISDKIQGLAEAPG